MDPAIVVAAFALIGVALTAVAGWAQHRQSLTRAADAERRQASWEQRSVARDEMESALTNQRARLDAIHGDYRQEIDSIVNRHRDELTVLHRETEALRVMADTAIRRAEQCDADLAVVRAELAALRGPT